VSRERVLEFFVGGPLQSLQFMQKCFPHMKKQGYGRIINTASHAALGADGFAAYAIAKGAVMSLTRSASKEWGQFGIVTNTIMPNVLTEAWDRSERVSGYKETMAPMVPVRYLGTPYDDLAPVIVFLASEQAGYVNGQVVAVDGGMGLIA
jgi:NAD(P)-dependent dehydrogenase (short-subunit alcohol dehydrogenase family)